MILELAVFGIDREKEKSLIQYQYKKHSLTKKYDSVSHYQSMTPVKIQKYTFYDSHVCVQRVIERKNGQDDLKKNILKSIYKSCMKKYRFMGIDFHTLLQNFRSFELLVYTNVEKKNY